MSRFGSTNSLGASGRASEITQFDNNDSYEGEWDPATGKPDGVGIYKWEDGSVYEGEWKEGLKHGNGRYKWADGAEYNGDWHEGRMHGTGTFTSTSGSSYHGSWLNDSKHGLGTKRFAPPSEDVYEGLWKEDRPEGPGRYKWTDGSEYDGEWAKGRMHGQGTIKWASRERYDGGWRRGKQHGMGRLTSNDGSIFIGRWKNGNKHGEGVLLSPQEAQAGESRRSNNNQSSLTPPGSDNTNVGSNSSDTKQQAGGVGPNEGNMSNRACIVRKYNEGRVEQEARRSIERLPDELRIHWQKQNPSKQQLHSKPEHSHMPGDTIYKNHSSYELMRQLQLGIRWSVGKVAQANKKKVEPEDIEKKTPGRTEKQYFPKEGSSTQETPPHSQQDFEWKDYFQHVFASLREHWNVDQGEYVRSLCGDKALRQLGSPGKSGSVFFMSHDASFILKTIRKHEKRHLLDLLPLYYEHVKSNPHTLLTKFYGLHRIKPSFGRKVRFMVMGNLLNGGLELHRSFDLKGSTFQRYTKPGRDRAKCILKDLDLHHAFRLEGDLRDRLIEQLQSDSQILEKLRVMDYSLLVGIHVRDAAYLRKGKEEDGEADQADIAAVRQGEREEKKEGSDSESSCSEMSTSGSAQRGNGTKEAHKEEEEGEAEEMGSKSKTLREVARVIPEKDEALRPVPGAAGATDELQYAEGRHEVVFGRTLAATAVPKTLLASPRKEAKGGRREDALPEGPVDVVISFGIIDILQEYNASKRLEHRYRSMIGQSNVSCVNPKQYADRFNSFLSLVFD